MNTRQRKQVQRTINTLENEIVKRIGNDGRYDHIGMAVTGLKRMLQLQNRLDKMERRKQ